MKRALCLYIPHLSTDRLRGVPSAKSGCRDTSRSKEFRSHTGASLRRDSARKTEYTPIATVLPHAQVLRIAHVNKTASDLRIHSGQTLADAKAIVPQLVIYADDSDSDRRQLEALAVWADRFSPTVHLEDDDTLIIDVTGCERLFGGEQNLLDQAIEGLLALGFTARGAIADTLGGSWALAHASFDPVVISPPGQLAADLVSLPVWSLRINPKTARTLDLIGVETVASLLHLPRSSLASRFGDALLDRVDQALGDLLEVLVPYRPQPALSDRLTFGSATTQRDVLQEAMTEVTKRFCKKLTEQVSGVRHLFVTFSCPEIVTEDGFETRRVTNPVSLSLPTRSVRHLTSLLHTLLDGIGLPGPSDSITLWTRQIYPLDDWQDELFTTDFHDKRELGDLLDRLATRLGPHAVVKSVLLGEHQPERAFRYVPVTQIPNSQSPIPNRKSPIVNPQSPIALRPLRLSPRPVEIVTTAIVPEGPPIAFRWRGRQHVVADSVGPERIETGWWRGPHIRRDYYRVTTETGRRLWLFRQRDSKRWFLHGWFD